MKIGILQTAYKKSEEYGAFYNVQELGLARALANKGYEVNLYKAVDGASKTTVECNGLLIVNLISVKYFGINGLLNPNVLDKSLDVLVYFCDTQLRVPKIYNYCKVNGIKFIPYVGVVESHSENAIKRFIMGNATRRNLRVYRNCKVLAKTPAIIETLDELGCKDVELFPVGLDESVMVSSQENDRLASGNSALLFIGRMEEEKQPLEMVDLFDRLLDINDQISLTMIGDGYLYEEVKTRLDNVTRKHGIDRKQIELIQKVPYEDIQSYYESADLYVNLNKVEILGMSILESMYYFCPILAITAPGPEFILKIEENEEDKEYCGMVAPDMEALFGVMKLFVNGDIDNAEVERLTDLAGQRVRKAFLWSALADKLIRIIES